VASSPEGKFSLPQIGYTFTSRNSGNRDQAFQQFLDDAQHHVNLNKLANVVWKTTVLADRANPLTGGPSSLQGLLTNSTLDLTQTSESLGEGGSNGYAPTRFDASGLMFGGQAGRLSASSLEASYVQRGAQPDYRVAEAGGGKLTISAPISVMASDGAGRTNVVGALRMSYAQPLLPGRWVVAPSAGIGWLYSSDNLLESGALYSLGVSSLFRLADVGKGHLVLGNSVVYASTFAIPLGNELATPRIANTIYRNGLAYQIPLGGPASGHAGMLRASYAYTCMTGDRGPFSRYHELALNYATGRRQGSTPEGMRLGVVANLGGGYTGGAVSLGYVF